MRRENHILKKRKHAEYNEQNELTKRVGSENSIALVSKDSDFEKFVKSDDEHS
jgi:hypothetical protein